MLHTQNIKKLKNYNMSSKETYLSSLTKRLEKNLSFIMNFKIIFEMGLGF